MQPNDKELSPKQLRREFDLSDLEYETTEQIPEVEDIIGQDRAIRAIRFGLNIKSPGYNIYVTGRPNSGRTSAVKNIVKKVASEKDTPPDFCYVHNFDNPDQPLAIPLPAGKGKSFKKDMGEFIDTLKKEVPKAFQSDNYKERRKALLEKPEKEKKAILSDIEEKARKRGFRINRTPFGFVTIPVKEDGQPLKEEEYESLSDEEKEKVQKNMSRIQQEVAQAFEKIKEIDRKSKDSLDKFNREVAQYVVEQYVNALKKAYQGNPRIIEYLDKLVEDVVENIEDFFPKEQKSKPTLPLPAGQQDSFTRYQVNLIVDNSETEGAPVVVESNPTYGNLFGRIERKMQFGAFMTDFTRIKAGAIHRANGGYLVIDALRALMYPYVWDTLKRALQNEEIKIEDIGEQYGFFSTTGLKPSPIPLDIKVIMIGQNFLFNLLHYYDENFEKIFKVRADFDWEKKIDDDSVTRCAQFLSKLCREEKLRHFDKTGLAALLEHSSRQVEDQNKLSLLFGKIANVAREANYWAKNNGNKHVTREDVHRALEEMEYRSNIIENKISNLIEEGTLYIDTEGEKVGQVNGLSVFPYGEFLFGKPSRITAQTFMGNKGVINIEREAKLSGKTHDKGVLILSGYMGGKYGGKAPLSLSTTLTFEQSYSYVEGDSASAAELFTILSSLAEVPIKQSIAVTGSINQRGEIQPIGGVNAKIEGFFEICKRKGLNGEQGVMIPHSNVKNLMLKPEVIQAVEEGKFHIYSIKTVDEGIEILTGMPAGQRGPDGKFPEGTVNRKVEDKLFYFLQEQQKFKKISEREGE